MTREFGADFPRFSFSRERHPDPLVPVWMNLWTMEWKGEKYFYLAHTEEDIEDDQEQVQEAVDYYSGDAAQKFARIVIGERWNNGR